MIPVPITASQLDLSAAPRREITSVLDLVGDDLEVTLPGQRERTRIISPFPNDLVQMREFLPKLLDYCTVFDSPTLPPGRINIFEAPRSVLLGIPNLTPDVVEQILALRSPDGYRTDPTTSHEAWLLLSGMVDLPQMRTLMPILTARGDVYRAQVVGYFDGGGAASRIEAVIDATGATPRVVFWRDMSHLGRGFPLQTLGVAGAETLP